MEKLKGSQRKWLRGMAHALKPVVQIGKQGLTEGVISQVDTALADHELIKVQAVASKEEKQEVGRQLEEATGAEVVGLIGHILILFRQNADPEKQLYELPE
ncbi:MAG TPA: ribosome assembly RNA-binding protein YhbY [Thermoanaerobaculia bacterium]|nr:ribosome assembly RNA-binding protein YhbY [Thermoanaerobaculia bacterium]